MGGNGVSLQVTGGAPHTSGGSGLVPISSLSGPFTVEASQGASILELDGTFDVTLPTTFPSGFQTSFVNVGTGVITFVSAATIDAQGVTMPNQWGGATAYWNGARWVILGDIA